MHSRRMESWVVTGGSSGLGQAIITEVLKDPYIGVVNVSHEPYPFESDMVDNEICDLAYPHQVREALSEYDADVLINCAGVNHIEWFDRLETGHWDKVMDINARAIFLTTAVMLDSLVENRGTVLNIVSNASHIPMTASLVYNASKAAAHMMTLQMARELTPRGITVFGISPAKLKDTAMSTYIAERVPEVRGWTPEYAEQYQRNALLTGEEIDPATLAEFIVWLLSDKARHFHLSGCVIPYGS